MQSLRELFMEELKDLYSAEQQIVKALPKIAGAVSSPDLRNALEEHLRVSEGHIERLEQIFENEHGTGKGKKCEGMEGLLKEGAEMLQMRATPSVKDAGVITAAQRVEHYEIAAYGSARAFAEELGDNDAARLLQETLTEEGDADKKLTAIAKRINVMAAEEDEESESDGGEEEETDGGEMDGEGDMGEDEME